MRLWRMPASRAVFGGVLLLGVFTVRSGPTTISRADWTANSPDSKVDAARHQAEGYRAVVEDDTELAGAGGLSWVFEVGSHAAALKEEQAQVNEGKASDSADPGLTTTSLTSSQIPTSQGLTQGSATGADANLWFVEGRCVIFVAQGTKNATSNPSPPVLAAALKVDDRTKNSNGVCG
jgi:hypothetical protein